ncbi:MAG: PepSY domain-containing protein [Alphaproteobacteria bacterium]|nr:MAG: PepSY domain-containing protein [Alphaproteobacteria bacterium]
MRTIRKIHLYAGLALSTLLVVIALSGSLLVWKEAWWRAVYDPIDGPPPALTAQDKADALAIILDRYGTSVRTVKFPTDELPAWVLYLDDGQALLNATTLAPIDQWRRRERLMPFLFDLHAHLLMGETGEQVAGFAGLAGVVMALTGIILWWPARRRFRLAHLWPQGTSRPQMIRWHRDLGLVFAPLLLVLLLTGSGMIFYQTSMAVLNGLFGAPERISAPIPEQLPGKQERLTRHDLTSVQAAFPDGQIVFYSPPREGNPTHSFRLKRPCEIHPNGRTRVVAAATDGEILLTSDACAVAGGQKAQNLLYPLHAGKVGSLFYKWLVFAGGLTLAALAFSGVWAYARKIAKGERRRRQPSARPIA